MQRFLEELKRRNVIRAGVAYLAASWLLVQLLETLFPIFGLAETSIRWFVVALAIGFVPCLLLAWAFEWTSHGIKRDAEVPHEPADVRRRSRRLDRTIIVILTVAVGYFATDKYLLEGAREESPTTAGAPAAPNTIAVLPFVDLSPDGDQEYFSDGISEELLNLLAQIPELRVAARTSSFSFKGRNLPIREIAAALDVAHALEGSVRRAGERLRITAQLVSAADGFHLWSQTYDRPVGDVFDVQEEISASIVEALQLRMLGDLPNAAPAAPEAHALYLQGRYLERQGSRDSMVRAGEFFEQALEIDPRNAGAYAQLAWIEHAYEGNLDAAAEYTERALRLAPGDPVLLGNTAVLLQSIGRLDEAIALHEYCLARSPVDPRSHFSLGLAYYFAHRFDEAEERLRKTLALSPDYASGWYRLGTILLFQGELEEAQAAFEREQDEAYRAKGRALVMHSLGRQDASDEALAELIEGWADQWPSEVAQVHAYRGEIDAAFEWLDRSFEIEGPAGWGEFRLMLLYDNLRDDPRWQRFMERVGSSDEQLAAIRLRIDVPEADR